jgi:hypothetical protein
MVGRFTMDYNNYDHLIGKTVAEANQVHPYIEFRVMQEGMAYSMECRGNRVNVSLDDNGIIKEITSVG